ncbi:flavin reductase family protein [Streptomyces genisteinicus]|uniref:Flavin reductase family protein n=1 Tax=Streptomyces genisteinicus TaxID=2768068 RepID=A0A7H0I1H9_9ACTN|nr:flavin reductase family protein [Streptomyces genisteinicus]QNP66645.1 flavin reductase family protein [Streptomyces genisteinicus]
MSRLAAAVTIVATRDDAGERRGFTATSVTSASLDPPLLLVGISRTSSCREVFRTATEFTVNVLDDGHRNLARRFAAPGVDRFAEGDFAAWPGGTAPRLVDAHVSIRCAALDVIPVGDHEMLVGGFVEARFSGPGDGPLLWYRRGFGSVAAGDGAAPSPRREG